MRIFLFISFEMLKIQYRASHMIRQWSAIEPLHLHNYSIAITKKDTRLVGFTKVYDKFFTSTFQQHITPILHQYS